MIKFGAIKKKNIVTNRYLWLFGYIYSKIDNYLVLLVYTHL